MPNMKLVTLNHKLVRSNFEDFAACYYFEPHLNCSVGSLNLVLE